MTSTISRPPMKPADIRRRAYGLMRQCWLTLLIAAVLMSLFGWVKDALEAHGKELALRAYNAHMDAFYAENPMPSAEAMAEYESYMEAFDAYFDGRIESLDDLPEISKDAWRYTVSESFASHTASNLYEDTLKPWTLAGYAIDLIDLIFSCIIAVRLCRGLLAALRGGECTPHCLLSGWERIPTAAWLAVQMALRILGWMLIPLILSLLLYNWFGSIGELIGLVLMWLVAIWAELHYALAEVHLADDQDGVCTATDCLRYSVDDMDQFTVRAMLRTVWPIYAVIAVSILFIGIAAFIPALSIPADIISNLLVLLSVALKYACYVCVYDEMRQRDQAAKDAIPATEGLSRARALAAGESAD